MENPFLDINNRLTAMEQLLKQLLIQQPANAMDTDEIGGIDLAIKITGLKQSTIYCHVSKNKIPYFKRGGRVYFSKQALQKWITEDERKIETKETLPPILFPRYQKSISK